MVTERRSRHKDSVAQALIKLLTLKFVVLDDSIATRIRGASLAELELWTERVLSASSIAEVLS